MSELLSAEEYKKLPSLKDTEPLELATALHDVLYDKRGKNIKVLHVEEKTTIAHYFVICTGSSSTQVRGLADEAEYRMGLRGLRAYNVEGRGNGSWILIDYGTVIVHVFSKEARDFYNLDKLYNDTTEVKIDESDEDGE